MKHKLDDQRGAHAVATHMLGNNAPEARYRCGAHLKKAQSSDGTDTHAPGTKARVLGSVHVPNLGVGYIVHFEGDPEHHITFITEGKLEPL